MKQAMLVEDVLPGDKFLGEVIVATEASLDVWTFDNEIVSSKRIITLYFEELEPCSKPRSFLRGTKILVERDAK